MLGFVGVDFGTWTLKSTCVLCELCMYVVSIVWYGVVYFYF